MTRTVPLSEAQIQQHVVKLLEAYARTDVCWWHCPNGELRNHTVGAKLKLAGVRAGVADINLVAAGRFHAVELKTEIGTLSAKQLQFREDIERAGGMFHVAFGLNQAIGILNCLDVFRSKVTISAADASGVRRRPWEASADRAATRAHLTPHARRYDDADASQRNAHLTPRGGAQDQSVTSEGRAPA